MATTPTSDDASPELDLGLPEDREYETEEDAALDAALVRAIRRAEDADNRALAKHLRSELKAVHRARSARSDDPTVPVA